MIFNPFHGEIYHFTEISSTMDAAKENLGSGALFVADYQTKGRGRIPQRQWQAQKGKNLLFTLILPLSGLQQAPLSLLAALALRRVLFSYGFDSKIKWPNDVLVNDAKIAGILVEIYQNYALLGVGINVNQTDFSDIEKKVTSIKLLKHKNCDCDGLLTHFLGELHTIVHNQHNWNREINQHLWAKDQIVDYYLDVNRQKKIHGKVLCVQADGALQMISEYGLEVLYSAEN